MEFGAKIKKLNLNQKITYSLGVFFVFTALVPVTILSINSYQRAVDTADETRQQWMIEHTKMLSQDVTRRIENKQNLFLSFLACPQINHLLEWKASNISLKSEFTNATLIEQTKGDFYTQRIQNVSYYQFILEFFMNQTAVHENLDMLRIMAADGNVLVGVIANQEDLIDFKGDKQWLQDTLTHHDKNSIIISPISLARITGHPTIRYSLPLYSNGSIEALIVANFAAKAIVDEINEDQHHDSGFSVMIDLNYENAEGQELGEVYIAHSLDPLGTLNYTFNEENAGLIEFKSEFFKDREKLILFLHIVDSIDMMICFDTIIAHDQEWKIIHAIEITDYYAQANEVQQFSITLFLITIVVLGIIGGLLLVLLIRIFGQKEKQMQELRSLLPICANCKKIRDDHGYWNQIEDFLRAHEDLDFTHSICDHCARELYPELYTDEDLPDHL